MDTIPRFKAGNIDEGKHSVVGDCNGHTCEERWRVETPIFARAILSYLPEGARTIIDYGCGVGRLAAEILKQNKLVTVIGVDASRDELNLAKQYVNDSRFIPILPEELEQKADLIYSVYVLQHVPAIELRHAIERMHYFLKPEGALVYCSSDYRMAINQHGGFTDDTHLGVDIRRELSRLFVENVELFDLSSPTGFLGGDRESEKLIRDIVTAKGCQPGSIPHPAKVFKRRNLIPGSKQYFAVGFHVETAPDQAPGARSTEVFRASASTTADPGKQGPKRLILQNRLSPGDILVMSAAIRALHKAYPGRFLTDVDCPVPEIWENNPHITKLAGDGQRIDMHYPLISDHQMRGLFNPGAGVSGRHFSDGHRKFLEEVLELEIPRSGLTPDLYLTQDEKLWPSPVLKEHGHSGRYWVINAGSKSDYTLKQYHRYQQVVDFMAEDGFKFVQIGVLEHNHPALNGVLDMRGKTGHRTLYRTIFHADGVLSCVSYPMHIAAALGKPCVVVAGGRESTRWELYPNHRFLHTNGALPCCAYDGCWKSKIEECSNVVNVQVENDEVNLVGVPKCMEMIRPYHIADAIKMYYEGGILQPLEEIANV